jgi:hypothetical protein
MTMFPFITADDPWMIGFVLCFCSFSIDVPNSKGILSIIKITPQQSPTDGGIEVVIQAHDLVMGVAPYCRFDKVIVQGYLLPDTSLQCISPNHTRGEVGLSISLDKVYWSEGVPFRYVQSYAVVWHILAILVGIFALCFFIRQLREWRNARRKKYNIQSMSNESYITCNDPDATIRPQGPFL